MSAWLKEKKKMESSGKLPWRNYVYFLKDVILPFFLLELSALTWTLLPHWCGRHKALLNQGPPHPWAYSFTEANKVILPTEESGQTLKKRAVVQLIALQPQLYGCKSVLLLVSTLSTRKRREKRKWPKREHVWSCTEWMAHSVHSGKNISISWERSKVEKGQSVRRRTGEKWPAAMMLSVI